MILISRTLLAVLPLLAFLALPREASSQQPAASGQQPAALVRRIASTALLAAQEYQLGFENDRVVATAEIDEAKLFLTEAARAAAGLPSGASETRRRLEATLALVNATAPPDSVTRAVQGLVADLAERFGVELDEVPVDAPSLAGGAALYQTSCARCHGALGRADGRDAVGLIPPATDLAQPELHRDASPLDFYRRVTIGIAGTAMPAFEHVLSPADRWAVAAYASTLRLPAPAGAVPPALGAFATTGRMSDAALLQALGPGASLANVAAVRAGQAAVGVAASARAVFSEVRSRVDSAVELASAGQAEAARQMAFDAYLAFERVERDVRVKDARLAGELEASFAALREQASVGAPRARLEVIRGDLRLGLEKAERAVGDRLSPLNLFTQSLVLLLREGLEAILVVGALIAFLVKTGAANRRRDVHVGVGAAIAASLLTALTLETIFHLSPAGQELLEGVTMAAATAMLFYVSYWLLSKIEVARWNRFVKDKVREAVSSGSALALATVAFLAVYREGFETVLFYKALMLTAGGGGIAPVLAGMLVGALALAIVYLAINRFGVRLPLKPFFAVTSAFLYYMAFVFAGKAVAEFQESGAVSTTLVEWAPRIPMLGIYPTVESLAAQGLLAALALAAVAWTFWIAPARRRAAAAHAAPAAGAADVDREVLRSLDRIEADVAEIRSEVERLRDRVQSRVER